MDNERQNYLDLVLEVICDSNYINGFDETLERAKRDPEFAMGLHLKNDIAMDSLDIVEMQMAIEMRLDINVSDADWEKAMGDHETGGTIGHVVNYLHERVYGTDC